MVALPFAVCSVLCKFVFSCERDCSQQTCALSLQSPRHSPNAATQLLDMQTLSRMAADKLTTASDCYHLPGESI